MRENSLKIKKRPLRIAKAIKTEQSHIKKKKVYAVNFALLENRQ